MSSRNRFRNNTNRNKYGQSVKVGENRDANALERTALITLLNTNVTRVSVPYRDDLTVGEVIRINLPSTEIEEDVEDKLNQGLYLITGLRYDITPTDEKARIILELVREGFDTDLASYSPTQSLPTSLDQTL